MKRKIFIILIILVGVAVLLTTYLRPYVPLFSDRCFTNYECGWEITNCCPETAGAKWECVNKGTYRSRECPETILCPQVISPRPAESCVCEQGACVVK